MKVCPTNEKCQKLRRAVNDSHNKEANSIRKVAGLVGLLVSYSPAVQYGRVHVKEVELQKYAALKEAKRNFEQKMRVSGKALTDIECWVQNIDKTERDLTVKNPRILIYTDASTEGWGAIGRVKRQGAIGSNKKKRSTSMCWNSKLSFLDCRAWFMNRKCEWVSLQTKQELWHMYGTWGE